MSDSVRARLQGYLERAAPERPAVTHGDYHPNNVLAPTTGRPDGIAVVIDWTNWAVTDPRFDLAWALVLAQAYAGPALRDAVPAGYERARGARVENLGYFEAYACARRLANVAISLRDGAERMGMRPEAVAMMRARAGAVRVVTEMLAARTGIRVTV